MLMSYLLLFLATELDLANKTPGMEHPIVNVRVCMSPTDLTDWAQKMTQVGGQDPHEIKHEDGGAPWGVLYCRDAYQQSLDSIGPKEKQMLEDAKDQLRRSGMQRKLHLVLVNFTTDEQQSTIVALPIPLDVAEIAGSAKPFRVKSLLKGIHEVPFTKDSVRK